MIKCGVDIVIVSRYVLGGVVKNWYWYRKLIFKGVIMIGCVVFFRIRNVKDFVSGFFVFRREVVEGVEFNFVGFKIFMEILVKGYYNNVREVFFIFGLRKVGESKFGSRIIVNYFRYIYRFMRWEGEIDRLVKFFLVGFFGVFVNEGFFWVFVEFFGWDKVFFNILVIEFVIFNNFMWNDIWIFRDLKNKFFLKRLVSFYVVVLSGVFV